MTHSADDGGRGGAALRLGLLLALWLVLGGGQTADAQDIPPRPPPSEGLVIDRAGVLAPEERADLNRRLIAFDDTSSSQIVVVLLPDIGGADPAQFATELGRRWGVGQAEFNNGVVLLVSMVDRKVFIATGYGLEGAIPDALAGRIVRNVIVPAFRQGRFYAGISEAVDALIAAAAGEYRAGERRPPGHGPDGFDLATLFMVLIIVMFLLSAARKGGGGGGRGGRTVPRRRRGGVPPVVIIPGGWGRSSGGWGGGGFGGGSGLGGGGAGGGW